MRLDPSLLMEAMGYTPDPWQRRVLRSRSERMLLLAHRQSGKSLCVSALAIGTALFEPDSLVLLVSASQRQSGELFRKCVRNFKALGSPQAAVEDSATTLALDSGSRIVSLPDSADTLVGFSAPKLVVIDEGARTSDETFMSVVPMLTVSRGRLVCMSTPLGKRGWFYEAWEDRAATWERVIFKASMNPRLDPAYLAEMRRVLGDRWYMQDFECSFEDAVGQVFSSESIHAAFTSTETALF
jgi:hypothetical protein